MNILQKNLFQLLTEIDIICKEHDIKYFLAGGNALGAVRNHCFLPWDDDLDLYITRDEWNKLKHVLESEDDVVPEGRSFIYYENTPYYCNTIPRYVNNETTAIYKSQALAGKACGQHIELLIMDPIPNDEEMRKKYIDLLHVYTELLTPYYVVNQYVPIEEWERHYKLYQSYCDRVDEEGEEAVIKELEDELQCFPTEECDDYCMRWGNHIFIYKKDDYGDGRIERFEGKDFTVAERAEGIFRVAYGDNWMYIPEFEEQVIHSGLRDINIPFSEYTDKYINKINRKTVFEKYKRNKRSNASVLYKRKQNEKIVAEINNIVKSKDICQNLETKTEHLDSLLKNKEYDAVINEFKDYLKLQFGKNIRKYNIFVPISEENLKILLWSFIGQGRYYEANKILNIRKAQEEPLSNELEKIDEAIIICRELSIARYDEKDAKLVETLIEKYERQYPDLLDIYRGKVWLEEGNAKSIEDYKSLSKLCEEILEIYPFDGEIMASCAKAKLECGNEEEAMNLYKKSIENTRNGLIWQKVEEESGVSRIEIERDLIEGKQ